MTIKGVSHGLSIKDLLADILTREQFIADRLNEIVHEMQYVPSISYTALDEFHREYGFPDYESPLLKNKEPDHLVIYKHRNIGLDEIVAQELTAYSNILAGFHKISSNQCLDHDLFHRIAEQTYRPYRRLGSDIRRWLEFTTMGF